MNTVKAWQADRHRVRIVLDAAPDEPYDDGSSPLVRILCSGYTEQVKMTSYELPYDILNAARHFQSESDKFERYLRIWHGTREIVWRDDHSATYVTFDTAHWREHVGLTDEWLAAHPDVKLANMSEWSAYLDGDVFSVITERRDEWRNTTTGESRQEWQETDSVWGFYGMESAEDAAREQLDTFDANLDWTESE